MSQSSAFTKRGRKALLSLDGFEADDKRALLEDEVAAVIDTAAEATLASEQRREVELFCARLVAN